MMANPFVESLFSLQGKVALVIGGTGELCGAMAEGLAGAGAEVVLVGRSEEKAKARLDRIHKAGSAGGGASKSWFLSADIAGTEVLQDILAKTMARSKKIDIVVNGAGMNSATPFFDISEEEWLKIFALNYGATFQGCQVFGKYLVERGEGGSIINLGSMSGVVPLSRVFTYSASKAAVHNLTKNLAREWAPHRVRVNTLVPGFFPAEQNRKVLTPDRVQKIIGHTPMGRFGEPPELVGATLLLASDKAGGFITGLKLIVDGGYSSMTI